MTSAPALSVVLPVRDAAPFLDACLTSVLDQDFGPFELIALDDGSTDGTRSILERWAGRDSRIRLASNAQCRGAAASSNQVVELAAAPLIARMDADDLMAAGRLSAQMRVFADDPDCVLVGGLTWTIDATGRRVRDPDLSRLLRPSRFAPFAHSTVMFRREAWARCGGYRSDAEKWEDVDFFLRMAEQGTVWTLTRPLGAYRQHISSSRFAEGLPALESAMDRMCRTVAAVSADPRARIMPQAYRFIGATLLWSGGRPALLQRMLARIDFRRTWDALATLAWAAAAQAAPRLLRQLLRLRLALANRRAAARLAGRERVRWAPPPVVTPAQYPRGEPTVSDARLRAH